MASTTSPRAALVTIRGAADLKQVGYTGTNTPYLEVTLAGTTVTTKPNVVDADNPVFDQTFPVELPPANPNVEPPVLHVTAKNAARLLPDRTIGSGTLRLMGLFVKGSEEVRVPLQDAANNAAGVAYASVRMVQEDSKVPSAAGTVLGEVPRGPEGGAAVGKAGPDFVPTVAAGPATSLVGAAAPGGMEDPSKPTYGILQD